MVIDNILGNPLGAAPMNALRHDQSAGRRPVLMAEVARLAGVSSMTVSRVLNTPERVRPETRGRVLAAVRQLGYRPNSAARVLATGRSGVLGVVAFDTTLYGPASMLNGIERAAAEAEYSVSIASLPAVNRKAVAEAVDRLRTQSVDGVIVIAPHLAAAEGMHDLPRDLPVVALGGGDGGRIPVASVDQRVGAVRATRHLLDLGHRTVWHLAGPEDWVEARERVRGWREALGDRPAPDPVVGDWSARSGYEVGRRLARDPEITAIFVANDQMAIGLLRALREAGRDVPGEVSVVGFDDIPEAAYICPPLTTVRQNFDAIGRRALRLLLGGITEQPAERSAEWPRLIAEPDLIVRESSAPPVADQGRA